MTIGLVPEPPLKPRVVEEAISYWQRCRTDSSGLPIFQVGAHGADRVVWIRYQQIRDYSSDSKHCGWFSGNTIQLFGYVHGTKGNLIHCGTLGKNLAHELGHVLGLADAPETGMCANHIMSDLNSSNLYSRLVMKEECQAVAKRWMAPAKAESAPSSASSETRIEITDRAYEPQ